MKKRNKKRRFFICQLYELDALKKYLEKMASEGWMLENKKGVRYFFVKCEPREIVFSVEVFDKASIFDVNRNQNNIEYIEYCKTIGWNFVCAQGKIQIFYSEVKNPVPIEADMKIKLKIINKTFCRQNIITWIIVPFMGILLFAGQFSMGITYMLKSYLVFTNTLIWLLLECYIIYSWADYFTWFFQSKKRVNNGEGLKYRGNRRTMVALKVLVAISILWIVAVIAGMNNKWIVIVMIAVIVIIALGSLLITFIMKKVGASAKVNLIVTIVGSIVITVLSISILTWVIIFSIFKESGHENAETYTFKENNGIVITTIYHDKIPLTLEDLGMSEELKYNTYGYNNGDFLILMDSYYESPVENFIANNKNMNEISYDIYQTDFKWIFKQILKEQFFDNRYVDLKYEEIEAEGFDADKVYFVEYNNYRYLVLYDDKIIDLHTNFLLNENQMKIVEERLR